MSEHDKDGDDKECQDGNHQSRLNAEELMEMLRRLLEESRSQTQYLADIKATRDMDACFLDKICHIICLLANETHAQRQQLAELNAAVASLLDLTRAVHPEQALQLEKLAQLRAEMERCCPPKQPQPHLICHDKDCDCRGGIDTGKGHSVKSRSVAKRIDGGDERHHEWEIEPHTLNDNEDLPVVPQGRIVGQIIPAKPTPDVLNFRNGPGPSGGGTQQPVTFRTFTNGSFTEVVWPPDMSGAKNGDVVLMSGNLWLRLSLDGGQTFTDLDFTKVFAKETNYNGWNGDQVIIYVPQIDCFVLYVQSNVGTGTNFSKSVVKVAIANTADIKTYKGAKAAWRRQWHFTSDTFGIGAQWLDFPDMSFGVDYLYLNTNVFARANLPGGKTSDTFGGKLFWELPLKDMQAGKDLSFQFALITDNYTYGSPCQNISDENYWAAHVSNSKMRIYNSKGSASDFQWRDIEISNWPQTKSKTPSGGPDIISAAPDSTDWLSEDHRIIGATKVGTQLWFAWTAASGNGGAGGFNFPQAHIQIAKFDVAQDYKKIDQTQVWNPNYTFAYASLATNSNNEVGISLAWGGGSAYGSHAVGILSDFVVWFGEASDMTSAYLSPTRFGDYLHCRLAYPDTRFFSGFGYAVKKVPPPTGGETPDYLYVEFGREPVPPSPLH
ncbi:MAG TPA: hypothetical protein VM659_04610 [Dongiaceae bacterium]|nr:hypothetical protein [Dongiaceae bacterium]